MPIIGLDPSLTHTGWVIFDEHKTGRESVLKGGVLKTSTSDGILVKRLLMQSERIRNIIKDNNIDFIATEAPYYQDYNTELLFALNQFLHRVYIDSKMFVIYIEPQTLKSHILPEIKFKDIEKHHMTHKAKKELGLMGKRLSEHTADAYFVGKIGHRFYRWFFLKEIKDHELTEKEKRLFCGKHTFKKGPRKGITEYRGIIYRENECFFDYRKHKNSGAIIKEIRNAKKSYDYGRVF